MSTYAIFKQNLSTSVQSNFEQGNHITIFSCINKIEEICFLTSMRFISVRATTNIEISNQLLSTRIDIEISLDVILELESI